MHGGRTAQPYLSFYIDLALENRQEIGNYLNGGSRKESEVAGFFVFSYIWMMGHFRLGKD